MLRYLQILAATAISAAVLSAPGGVALAGDDGDILGDINSALNDMTRARVSAVSRLARLKEKELNQHKILDVLLRDLAVKKMVNVRVRIAAIEAVGDIILRTLPDSKQEVMPALVKMLKDKGESLLARKESARAIGKMCDAKDVGDASKIRALEQLAGNEREDSGLRAIGVEAIGRISHEGSFDVLKKILREKDELLRRAVAVALANYLKSHKMDVVMMKQLLKFAADTSIEIEVRMSFLEALGRGGAGKILRTLAPELIKMLAVKDDPNIHLEVVKALAVIKDEVAIQPLAKAYKAHPGAGGAKLRAMVCEALGEFYEVVGRSKSPGAKRLGQAVTDTLVTALNEDADAEVCSAAAFSLGNLTRTFDRTKAVASLIEALTDQSRDVSASSLNSLKILTDQSFADDVKRWRGWYKANERSLRPRYR